MALFGPDFQPRQGQRLVWLTQGYFALIDADDWPLVAPFKWRVQDGRNGTKYAVTGDGNRTKKQFLHRLITNAPKGSVVDHGDDNGLNNTRLNLTVCGFGLNNHVYDRGLPLSGFRGVVKVGRRFRARIRVNGVEKCLGFHDTAEEAALAYDLKALEAYGPFAWTNTKMGRGALITEPPPEDIPF